MLVGGAMWRRWRSPRAGWRYIAAASERQARPQPRLPPRHAGRRGQGPRAAPLIELSANDDQAICANVRELAESHLADVREKIADLRAMERVLAEVVRRCAVGEAPGCPIIETLSAG